MCQRGQESWCSLSDRTQLRWAYKQDKNDQDIICQYYAIGRCLLWGYRKEPPIQTQGLGMSLIQKYVCYIGEMTELQPGCGQATCHKPTEPIVGLVSQMTSGDSQTRPISQLKILILIICVYFHTNSSGGLVECHHTNLIASPRSGNGHQPQSPGLWFQSFGTEYRGHSCEERWKYQLVGGWCLEGRDVLLPAVFASRALDGGQAASRRADLMIHIAPHMLMLRHDGSRHNTTYENMWSRSALL